MSASSRRTAARPARRPDPARPARAAAAPQPAPVDHCEVTRVLAPVVAAMDMDLEQVRVSAAGRRRVVRVIVDADGGVSLDDMALASREVSAALDAAGTMGEAPYTLEVSSPGVNRPLTELRHWRRAVGRLVTVPVPGDPAGAAEGRVLSADRDGVTLQLAGGSRVFGYAELGPGRVQVEFGALADLAGEDAAKEVPDGH
ncbi:MAG: ribosome maturation factor RimP [Streptosporangiaceae bacterium]